MCKLRPEFLFQYIKAQTSETGALSTTDSDASASSSALEGASSGAGVGGVSDVSDGACCLFVCLFFGGERWWKEV